MTKYLAALQKLATQIFSLGEDEGYQLRARERDLDADGNWVWGLDSRGVIVLRHRGEDCPDETLSELVMHLISIGDGASAETPSIKEPEAPEPAYSFLR